MRSLKNLDIEKSIQTKKLIYEEEWFERFDTFMNYFVFASLMLPAFFGLGDIKPSSNSDFEYLFYILPLIFGLYGFYCKFTEKNLKAINFNIHREEAKRRILEYGKKHHFRISKISSNLIFLNEPTNSFSNWDEEKTTIIFFKDQSIFYTLIQNGRKINAPVLFSQYFIRKDLKKILNQTKFDLTKKKGYFDMFFNDSN